jgi:glutamate racemase
MRIALINSGLGLLAPAAALHRMRPDADLVLASDPDGMPWGPKTPGEIADRALLCARAAVRYQPDVLVMACNTGSVHALEALRAEFEPDIPVIGTVPAIKPAAAACARIAIWATVATTNSAYQRRLIAEFGGSAKVTAIACPGLADAVDVGDEAAAAAAIAAGAAQTPAGCQAIVLGCTEYELAADRISLAFPGAVTFGSAIAVAAQALRRTPGDTAPAVARPAVARPAVARPAVAHPSLAQPSIGQPSVAQPSVAQPSAAQLGTVRVLLSGRPAGLPPAALRYPEGRLLAPLVLSDDSQPVTGPNPAVSLRA